MTRLNAARVGAVLTFATVLAGAGSGHSQPSRVAFIKAVDVHRILEQGVRRVLLVDVRSREEYVARHIRGAVSIPLGEIVARASEIPQEGLVVLY